MHRHFQCVVGKWKFENWHFYRRTKHGDAKTGGKKASWWIWDRML